MILKGLKTKSIQKATKKSILDRTLLPNIEKINSVGIVAYLQDLNLSAIEIKELETQFNCKQIQVINYTPKSLKKESNTLFAPKHFGWKGVLKHETLKTFSNSNLDLLITFSKQTDVYFDHIFAVSKAKFKVTNHEDLEHIADLTIHNTTGNFANFKNELIKYLTILNKL